jgi:hypothetical protein
MNDNVLFFEKVWIIRQHLISADQIQKNERSIVNKRDEKSAKKEEDEHLFCMHSPRPQWNSSGLQVISRRGKNIYGLLTNVLMVICII